MAKIDKKVIILCNYYYPFVGGCKYYQKVAEGLAKKGDEITVWTPKRNDSHASEEIINGVTVRRFRLKGLLSVWLFMLKNIVELINSNVVHGFDYNTILFWYLPFRLLLWRKPVFVTFLGHEGIFPIPRNIVLMRKLTELIVWGNICGGHYIAKWYGTKPDYVVYGGCDKPVNIIGEPKKDTAVFIGRIQADTGIMEYVQAIKLIKDKGYSMELSVYGNINDDRLFEQLKTYIQKHDLSIRYCGIAQSVEDAIQQHKYAFFSACLANLEAMICKRLVISIYSNPLKKDYLEMVPEATQMTVIASQPEELAGKLMLHIENGDERRKMIEKAYIYASTQTWGNAAAIHHSLFIKERPKIRYAEIVGVAFELVTSLLRQRRKQGELNEQNPGL
ncbi:glycosyltransferase family 4 protein [Candidatus Saganbacteria bacterium]|nr:glycosyltransferase family 4 protein [Candidatus Saganbacteria bacterium]